MFSNKMILTGALGACTLLLAGCGTTGAGTNAVYATNSGDFIEALESGETLYSDTSVNTAAGVAVDCSGASCDVAEQAQTFSVAYNDQDGIDVTVNGKTTSFTSDDVIDVTDSGLPDEWDINGDDGSYVYVDADYPGDYHLLAWYSDWDAASDTGTFGVAVVGAETMSATLDGKANATYSGYIEAVAASAGGDSTIVGDLEMSANFDAAEISGTISNMEGASGSLNGSISMDTAAIAGNAFSGDLSPSADFTAISGFSGTYDGKFYGPDGEEVAGTFSGSGQSAGGDDVQSYGAFTGSEN